MTKEEIRDEIENILEKCEHGTMGGYGADVVDKGKAAILITELLQEQLKQYEWIDVKERLPDKEGRYIVYRSAAGVATAVYVIYKDEWQWLGTDYLNTLTHWMPLPQPPTK